MKNIRVTIPNSINPLNKIYEGLGNSVIKTLIEKQENHRLKKIFKKLGKFPEFSNQEYKLSTIVYYGTPMTGKYKEIYDELIKNES